MEISIYVWIRSAIFARNDMADITMCQDNKCPKRERCYRANARIDPFAQSYFMVSPRHGKKCLALINMLPQTKRLSRKVNI